MSFSEIVSFKLKHLTIGNSHYTKNPYYIERNLFKFISIQSRSLERFVITTCPPNVVEHIIKMPALKYLKIREIFTTGDIRLNLNENIVELNVPQLNRIDDLEKILRVVPNLTNLSTCILTRQKIRIIAENLRALRTLRFNHGSNIALDDPIWSSLWPQAIPIRRGPGDGKYIYYVWSVEK